MREYNGFLVDDELNIYNKHSGKKLKPYVGSDGYMHVCGRTPIGKIRDRVHRILASTYIDNPNNYKYINHINSNKLDNEICNLEWCDNSTNVKHGWDSGNRTHKNRTKLYVTINGEILSDFNSIRECAYVLHIDRHKLSRILKGEVKNNTKYSFYYL